MVLGCQDHDDVLWIVQEVYQARMTDDELIRRIKPMLDRYPVEVLWCDPSDPLPL
jgi:hypothetical protein